VATCSERASEAKSRVPTTSVHAHFPPTHLSGKTRVYELGCPAWQGVASERASKTDALVGNSNEVCLSTASLGVRLGGTDKELR